MKIIPLDPRDAPAAEVGNATETNRQALGVRFPSRRTLGRNLPSRRTLGWRNP